MPKVLMTNYKWNKEAAFIGVYLITFGPANVGFPWNSTTIFAAHQRAGLQNRVL